MLPILLKIKKPRRLKSGRFIGRQQLIEFIAEKYYGTDLKQAQIARMCEISETLVANILESQELKDYRHFNGLDEATRPMMIIWPTDKVSDRVICQSMADYIVELESLAESLYKVEVVTPVGHPEIINADQAHKLYTAHAGSRN